MSNLSDFIGGSGGSNPNTGEIVAPYDLNAGDSLAYINGVSIGTPVKGDMKITLNAYSTISSPYSYRLTPVPLKDDHIMFISIVGSSSSNDSSVNVSIEQYKDGAFVNVLPNTFIINLTNRLSSNEVIMRDAILINSNTILLMCNTEYLNKVNYVMAIRFNPDDLTEAPTMVASLALGSSADIFKSNGLVKIEDNIATAGVREDNDPWVYVFKFDTSTDTIYFARKETSTSDYSPVRTVPYYSTFFDSYCIINYAGSNEYLHTTNITKEWSGTTISLNTASSVTIPNEGNTSTAGFNVCAHKEDNKFYSVEAVGNSIKVSEIVSFDYQYFSGTYKMYPGVFMGGRSLDVQSSGDRQTLHAEVIGDSMYIHLIDSSYYSLMKLELDLNGYMTDNISEIYHTEKESIATTVMIPITTQKIGGAVLMANGTNNWQTIIRPTLDASTAKTVIALQDKSKGETVSIYSDDIVAVEDSATVGTKRDGTTYIGTNTVIKD
jgi:hypothetical protein